MIGPPLGPMVTMGTAKSIRSVNNRFTDLRNQLALAYEGQSEALSKNLKTDTSIEEIFRRAQKAFNE